MTTESLRFPPYNSNNITNPQCSGPISPQKGFSSKLGKGYAGNEGTYNGGNNLRVWNYSTETVQSTVSKPVTNPVKKIMTRVKHTPIHDG